MADMADTHGADAAGRSLLRSGTALSLLTMLSRALGLVREMTKAALLGTSALSDAFSVAFMIPNLFRRLFAEGSIAVAFIPTLKEYLIQDRAAGRYREETREFISCMFTFLTFFVSIAVALGMVFCPPLVARFGLREFDEAVFLTRFMFPFLAFISVAALFQGILNSVHVFAPSGLAPVVLNVVTIAAAYGLSRWTKNPARAMAVGIIIGGFLEAALQLPFVLKKGFRFWVTGIGRALRNPGTRKAARLIGPTIVGMAAYQLNDLVSTILAGNAGEGIISGLQYSLRLQELILGVFAVSIGTVLLPDLSDHAKSGREALFNRRLGQAVDIIALIAIPVTFFFLAQGDLIIRVFFQMRNFDETSVALTRAAFVFHMPALFFIAFNRILAPAFYARGDTVSPTIAGVVSFGVNMALAALLVAPMKGSGIALALTVGCAANTVLLLVFLARASGSALRALLPSAFYAIKVAVFSAVAAVPVLLLAPVLEGLFADYAGSRFVRYGVPLGLQALLFAAAGIVMLAVSRDRQLAALLALAGGKRKRGVGE